MDVVKLYPNIELLNAIDRVVEVLMKKQNRHNVNVKSPMIKIRREHNKVMLQNALMNMDFKSNHK